jgi:hypothetical protein
MDLIDELFSETNVVSTREVAAALSISEADAREMADELGVARVGQAFAWAREDVESLADELDERDERRSDLEDEDEGDDETDEKSTRSRDAHSPHSWSAALGDGFTVRCP